VKPGPAANEADQEPAAWRDQVRQLQTDKTVLEAKLKEALAVQPAAVDPRELAKAEEKIKALQKENDLLKVGLGQERAQPGVVPDQKSLDDVKQALADARRQLAQATEKAQSLEQEKKVLQSQMRNASPAAANASTSEQTRKALEDANRRLAEQTETASKLALEKEALQSRMRTLTTSAEAAAALRAENEILKKQLAGSTTDGKSEDPTRQLAQAQARIAALQSDRQMLQLEKVALQNRVQQLSAPPVTGGVPSPSPNGAGDAARIKQLERERDDLLKKLDLSQKELYGRKGKTAAARVEELSDEVALLRARIGVFEARAVPYTTEELALFKPSGPKLAVADPNASKKSIRELPSGTATLLAEAQRYFSARQFDKAEEKYLQVLRQDDKNVYTLANLAAIQLELNRFAEAEKHVKQALALAPDDAYSLSILGFLKFRQEKYDEALEALSRAAQLNPQSAEIQNYLGVTLSHKGTRGPAETALRKAIQLEPNYASAHNNLAVLYLAQQPPLVELARWHYQKALAAGHPKNAELEKMLDGKKSADASR
jgi:tetratricopeptide (TPR) repeat protein